MAASEVLSGNQREADGEDRRRSRAEASEEGLSYLEAQGGPWEVHTVLWEACPSVGVGACQGAAVHVDLILVEQGVEAPCQEEQEEALASEAYLDACCQGGMVVVQVEVLHHPVGLALLLLAASALKGASLEASIQEEEQEGKHPEEACLALASQLPAPSGPVSVQTAVEEHLQTAGEACLPETEGFVQPGVALRPSRGALLWNLS